jgi:peptidoglycan hydrolase CwlO-like protein
MKKMVPLYLILVVLLTYCIYNFIKVNKYEKQLKELNAKIKNNENEIISLEGDVSSLRSDVEDLESKIDDLEGRVDDAESKTITITQDYSY